MDGEFDFETDSHKCMKNQLSSLVEEQQNKAERCRETDGGTEQRV